MFNRKKILLVAIMAALSDGAFASSEAEQIKSLNESVAVLSAQLAEMDMKAKIATKKQELERINGTSSSDYSPKELPVVRSIEGADGLMRATIATGGGATQTVIKGDKVGEWTVNKIDVNAVVLARGKQVVRLSFGTEPSVPAAPTQGGVATPGYPPAGMR
jgi:type IV pilus biogenesis protein PilP